ncbi:MAG: hypothetical protein KC445_05025 [Anaerolineales bacterium]|nr:hypothetical protein [Anaerolineales bacterium]
MKKRAMVWGWLFVSLSLMSCNIPIPPEVTTVTVRAHDLVDGFGGQEVVMDLTAVSGESFAITRLNQ